MDSFVLSHETLFELLRLERSRSELQQLPASFHQDVFAFFTREQAVIESSQDIALKRKKEIALESSRKICSELEDRRLKKVVLGALNKSRAPSSLVDGSKYITEEKELFNTLLTLFSSHQEKMQLSSKKQAKPDPIKIAEPQSAPEPQPAQALPSEVQTNTPSEPAREIQPNEEQSHLRVKFISPLPRFYGLELEEYGPFLEDDTENLPKEIATLLIEKKRAQPI